MKTLVSVMVSVLVAWGGLALDTRGRTIKSFRPVNTKLNVVAPLAAAELISRRAGVANAQRSVQTLDTDRSSSDETVYRF